ncbi:MAG: hypothetical protein DRP97_00890 [Candidatus Latescibacterota bacterium]|nr:HDOD domain-containing protein [Candidatus Latescibacterota bacterium]RKY72271.1 MAG: hypothetical protein DRP97_00890 [Candidatus Latescibacterota bacterium]
MNPNIKDIITGLGDLPTLPTVVSKVVSMCDDPMTSAGDMERVFSMDQALTAKVLKLINSSYFSLPRRVSSVTRAVAFLGFNAVKAIALTSSVLEMFSGEKEGSGFDYLDFWRHALGTAAGAKVLAKRTRLFQMDDAFVAGLLHDIGKIVLDQLIHDQYMEVLRCARDESLWVLQAEQKLLGFDHTEVGEMVADQWKLPELLSTAIRYHHSPSGVGKNLIKFVGVVHMADYLCRASGVGSGGDAQMPVLQPEMERLLGLSAPDREEVEKEIVASVEEAQVFLQMAG